MKFLVVPILLLAMFLQTFNRAFFVADYFINKDSFFAKCENKNRPQLKCHGKCQLMKKIREAENKDSENPERKSENKNETVYSSRSYFTNASSLFFFQNNFSKIVAYTSGNPIDRTFDIFHPPKA